MQQADINDTIQLTGKLEGGIRDLARAAEIFHEMIYNDGEDSHIKWMADRILLDTGKLVAEFEALWEAKLERAYPFRGSEQPAGSR